MKFGELFGPETWQETAKDTLVVLIFCASIGAAFCFGWRVMVSMIEVLACTKPLF